MGNSGIWGFSNPPHLAPTNLAVWVWRGLSLGPHLPISRCRAGRRMCVT